MVSRSPDSRDAWHAIALLIVRAIAIFSILLGAITLSGWYLHSPPLVQPFSGWMPLQPQAAILYMLCGAAIFAAASDWRRTAQATSVAIVVISSVVLLQYITGVELGIDTLVVDPFLTTGTSSPGRTAPNAALGFLLLGMGISLGSIRRLALRPLLLGMITSLLIALALIAIAGYLIDAERLYGWAYYPRMAAQTVLAFMTLGPSLLVFARPEAGDYSQVSWRPLFGSILVLVLTLLLWVSLVYQESDRIEQQVLSDAEDVRHELSARIDRHAKALLRMVSHLDHHGRPPTKLEWALESRLNLTHYEGFHSLRWIDSSGYVRFSASVRADPGFQRAAQIGSRERAQIRKAKVGQPVFFYGPQPESEPVLHVAVPVHGPSGFIGFVSAVLDVASFFPNLFHRHVTDYRIELLLAGVPVAVHGNDGSSHATWVREVDLDLSDLRPVVRLSPLPHALAELRSPIPWAVLGGGFFLSIMLLWALYLQDAARSRAAQLARTNRALTDEIAVRRQAELERTLSQARYRSLFESIRDAIVVTDRDHLIVACNPAFSHLFGFDLEAVRGRPSSILLERAEEAPGLLRLTERSNEPSTARNITYRKKSGVTFPGETEMFCLRDSDQGVTGYIKIIRDVTQREQAEMELRRRTSSAYLLHAVAAAANRASAIDEAAQMALDLVCAVMSWPVGRFHVVAPDKGLLAPVRVWHYDDDAALVSFAQVLSQPETADSSLPKRVLESGQTEIGSELSSAATEAGLRASVAFPVLIGSEVAGVLEFFLVDEDPPDAQVTDTLVQVATQLARVLERVRTREKIEHLNRELEQRVIARTTQLAASNAELEIEVAERKRVEGERELALQQEREARQEAEAAQARLIFLADATVRLSASLDYCATLDALANLVVPSIADWCAIDMIDADGSYRRVAAAHVSVDKSHLIMELQRKADSRQPCYARAVTAKRLCRSGHGCEPETNVGHAALRDRLGYGACACIPLTSGKDVLGVLVLVRTDPARSFTDVDRQLAEDLVRRAALAIEHARLYQAAQEEILERRRVEESLAAESGRLAVTLQSIGDGVITTDTNGDVVLINTIAEQLTGWTAADAVGRPLDEVFRVEASEASNRALLIMECGKPQDFGRQTQLLARDGTRRIVADSGAPIRDGSNGVIGAVLVFRDITEQQRMEEDLIKAQKLESVGLLAGGIAHDFNNILTAILGNISLARIYCQDGSPAYDILREAERGFWRARALTQQLLTFARGGAPIRRMASISELLSETVVFALRGTNTRGLFDIAPDLMPTIYDAGQMSQVINNLVINAAQAMPHGGVVKVGAQNVVLRARQVADLPAGKYVRVTIEDHGAGIAEEDLPKVFDPYFTTKPGGTGLGLATAYSIIKRHDGHIAVDSQLGQGSRFHIYLPIANGMVAGSTGTSESSGEAVQGHGRVLIMDDEIPVREVAAKLLRAIGYQVTEADCGKTALDLYADALKRQQPFEAVILDLTVPGGMGGQECLQHLRQIDQGVKAIVSSGYSNDPVMAEFARHGFCAVVAKPYRLHELAHVVSQVLAEPSSV